MKLVLYTDDTTHDVTLFTRSLMLTRSIRAPYEQLRAELQIPAEHRDILPLSSTGVIDLDLWGVLMEGERALFVGRLQNTSSGLEVVTDEREGGIIRSRPIQLSFGSWLTPLIEGEIYLTGQGQVEGHILDLAAFGRRFRALSHNLLSTRNVGQVLDNWWSELSPSYRLPKTLLNGISLLQFGNVAIDQDFLQTDRKHVQRNVFGLALNAAGKIGGGNTAWGLIRSIFDVEPNLIELFCTLEHAADQPLEIIPTIIYRIKPFIVGEIPTEAGASVDGSVQSMASIQEVATDLDSDQIISVDFSQNSEDRVNAVYLNTPLTPSRGVELFGLAGDPQIDRDDIERAGLRLYRGSWPFFPQGKSTDGKSQGFTSEIQYLIDLAAVIVGEDHRYVSGAIKIRGDFRLIAGGWLAVPVGVYGENETLFVYAETITHQIYIDDQGVIIHRTNIEFTRGHYA